MNLKQSYTTPCGGFFENEFWNCVLCSNFESRTDSLREQFPWRRIKTWILSFSLSDIAVHSLSCSRGWAEWISFSSLVIFSCAIGFVDVFHWQKIGILAHLKTSCAVCVVEVIQQPKFRLLVNVQAASALDLVAPKTSMQIYTLRTYTIFTLFFTLIFRLESCIRSHVQKKYLFVVLTSLIGLEYVLLLSQWHHYFNWSPYFVASQPQRGFVLFLLFMFFYFCWSDSHEADRHFHLFEWRAPDLKRCRIGCQSTQLMCILCLMVH